MRLFFQFCNEFLHLDVIWTNIFKTDLRLYIDPNANCWFIGYVRIHCDICILKDDDFTQMRQCRYTCQVDGSVECYRAVTPSPYYEVGNRFSVGNSLDGRDGVIFPPFDSITCRYLHDVFRRKGEPFD